MEVAADWKRLLLEFWERILPFGRILVEKGYFGASFQFQIIHENGQLRGGEGNQRHCQLRTASAYAKRETKK